MISGGIEVNQFRLYLPNFSSKIWRQPNFLSSTFLTCCKDSVWTRYLKDLTRMAKKFKLLTDTDFSKCDDICPWCRHNLFNSDIAITFAWGLLKAFWRFGKEAARSSVEINIIYFVANAPIFVNAFQQILDSKGCRISKSIEIGGSVCTKLTNFYVAK